MLTEKANFTVILAAHPKARGVVGWIKLYLHNPWQIEKGGLYGRHLQGFIIKA
jgi:hypothetical protein